METSGVFLSLRLMSEVVKLKLQIALHVHTHTVLAGCVLPQLSPAPVCPVISIGARVCEQSPPILLRVMTNMEEY